MNKITNENFSLKHTLESGQFFNYFTNTDNNSYIIIHNDNVIKAKQENNIIYFTGCNKETFENLFDLKTNYNQILSTFNDEHLINSAINYKGLRIMNQDLWECMIAFVCSSASNIPKIKLNIANLSKSFGNMYTIDNSHYYSFPSQGKLNDIEIIKKAKTGYRALYIYQINKIITENPKILDEIKKSNYETAKKKIMDFPGIGPKVADCICLFSLGHKEAFPIDTWVKQIIEKLYLKRKAINNKEIEQFITSYFKEHKGIKQQYLFHYIRHHHKKIF